MMTDERSSLFNPSPCHFFSLRRLEKPEKGTKPDKIWQSESQGKLCLRVRLFGIKYSLTQVGHPTCKNRERRRIGDRTNALPRSPPPQKRPFPYVSEKKYSVPSDFANKYLPANRETVHVRAFDPHQNGLWASAEVSFAPSNNASHPLRACVLLPSFSAYLSMPGVLLSTVNIAK